MPDDLLDRAHRLATHGPLRVELVTIAAEPAESAQLRERQLAAIVRLLRQALEQRVA